MAPISTATEPYRRGHQLWDGEMRAKIAPYPPETGDTDQPELRRCLLEFGKSLCADESKKAAVVGRLLALGG